MNVLAPTAPIVEHDKDHGADERSERRSHQSIQVLTTLFDAFERPFQDKYPKEDCVSFSSKHPQLKELPEATSWQIR